MEEVRTKFYPWTCRNEAPAQGDYRTLSAAIIGTQTKLANLDQRTGILRELFIFIRENLQTEHKDLSPVNCQQLSGTAKLVEKYNRHTRETDSVSSSRCPVLSGTS
jgi:hypothetical protein